ncbi:MAG: hypothetical protein H0T92_03535 [Pyrinomonadaceae bacterium]|nr:hypothetical protein [Pyrinomonadaceae bacterium]
MTTKLYATFTFFAMLAITYPAVSAQEKHGAHHEQAKHHFAAKEFDAFHDVLHPLQHEALPNNDFRTIRAKATELASAGEAITKLPLPKGAKAGNAIKPQMKRFSTALAKFKRDAAAGTDAQLKESYVAVHDTFETLAGEWPRK